MSTRPLTWLLDRLRLSTTAPRPIIQGVSPIIGSFPAREHYFAIGPEDNYCIHGAYQSREDFEPFDDTANTDGWQAEVYQYARELCDRDRLRSVCDVGCGSGFKLMRFFSDLDTVGLERPDTCAFLRRKWPDRRWLDSDFDVVPSVRPDLVIAADVIEHLSNPRSLLQFCKALRPRWIVLSTPERNLLRDGRHNGPPMNRAHAREWTFAEFDAFVGSVLRVREHFISSCAQATQCVLCEVAPSVSDHLSPTSYAL
jgi:hypothetical protein